LKFTEQPLAESEPRLRCMAQGKEASITEFSGIRHLAVNLLPAHPYQYPLHHLIEEMLTADTLSSLKRVNGFEMISFIAGKVMKNAYSTVFAGLDCRVIYANAEYPFNVKNTGIGDDAQVVDWFKFLTLAIATTGKSFEQIPVSMTTFGSKGDTARKILAGDIPFSLSEFVKSTGINASDFIITDHPFTGKVLSPDIVFDAYEPKELLAFPKDGIGKESLAGLFMGKFKSANRRFRKCYNATDRYQNKPCQKCLECARVCPAHLDPFLLSAIASKGSLKDAVELDVGDCSECGLCSCVCPSGIPLMTNILGLKKEL